MAQHSQKTSVLTMSGRIRRRTTLDVLLTIKPVFDPLLCTNEDRTPAGVNDAPVVTDDVFDAVHRATVPARRRKASRAICSAQQRNRGRLGRPAASSGVASAPLNVRKGSLQPLSELQRDRESLD